MKETLLRPLPCYRTHSPYSLLAVAVVLAFFKTFNACGFSDCLLRELFLFRTLEVVLSTSLLSDMSSCKAVTEIFSNYMNMRRLKGK